MYVDADVMATYPLPLRKALNDSITSGKFADTKVILFSRRDLSGIVCEPKALYASSHVLKTVPYFNDCKFFPPSLVGDFSNDTPRVLFGAFAEAESKDFSEPLDECERADDYGFYSDSDLEEDDIEPNETAKRMRNARGHPFDPLCFPLTKREPTPVAGEYNEPLRKGRVIKVQDVAFIT